MTKGYMVDSDRKQTAHSAFFFMQWVEGEPEHEDGLFGGKLSSLEIENKKKYVVMASRCTKCGYLDLYAV